MSSKKITAFAFTQTGSSHVKTGKICQDAGAALYGYDYNAIVICDGHGGDKHFRSDIGAKLGVEICLDSVRIFSDACRKRLNYRDAVSLFYDFQKSFLSSWLNGVEKHMEKNPFSLEELNKFTVSEAQNFTHNSAIAYGSTCLVAFICSDYLFIMQLGDGDIRVRGRRGLFSPLKDDDRLQFSLTTSLCDKKAYENIRSCVLSVNHISGCWLSSDGVKNSFQNEHNFCDFIKTVQKEYRIKTFSEFKEELSAFLPKLSKCGSGDDMSIAYLSRR